MRQLMWSGTLECVPICPSQKGFWNQLIKMTNYQYTQHNYISDMYISCINIPSEGHIADPIHQLLRFTFILFSFYKFFLPTGLEPHSNVEMRVLYIKFRSWIKQTNLFNLLKKSFNSITHGCTGTSDPNRAYL